MPVTCYYDKKGLWIALGFIIIFVTVFIFAVVIPWAKESKRKNDFIQDRVENYGLTEANATILYETAKSHEIMVDYDKCINKISVTRTKGRVRSVDNKCFKAIQLDDYYHISRYIKRLNEAKTQDIDVLMSTLNDVIVKMEKRAKSYIFHRDELDKIDQLLSSQKEEFLQTFDDRIMNFTVFK